MLRRFRFKHEQQALANQLQAVFGQHSPFGSDDMRTMLLLMVMCNATTDSPWPLSNNPRAQFNSTGTEQDNLVIPLWQLIRASTAAPTYFPPEEIVIGNETFLFVDGAITTINNPVFQMFIMATIPSYRVQWPAGEQKMLIVSVGTGHAPNANRDLQASEMNLLYNAGSIPSALMTAALHEQDTLCRVFGKCLVGDPIDIEVGDLKGAAAPGGKDVFTYLRYNAELTEQGLDRLGLQDIGPRNVQMLDSIASIYDLQRVGRAIAQSVDRNHYEGFFEALHP